MNKILAVAAAAFFSAGIACAQTSAPAATSTAKPMAPAATASSCESQAIDKNGKPLAGAAKTSFVKKCETSKKTNVAATCATKAVGKDGKPLAGAAKTSFMKKCEADASN